MIALSGIPTLETGRLTLRGPRPSDADVFVPFFGTERARHVGGPMTEKVAWNHFATNIGHWVIHGFGMFMVTLRGDETPLGMVGHWFPQNRPETELGWVIFDPAAEGRGIAYEAATACAAHGWSVLGWTSMVSYIARGNDRSVALARRLGAVPDSDAAVPNPDEPCLVYRHRRT